VLASVNSGGWSAAVSVCDSFVLRFLRGCCSETSLWVRVRTPFGRVLLDCDESSDARLLFAAVFGAVEVALDAGF